MTRSIAWLSILATLVGVAACSNPITARKPWDDYAGETLQVHGADRATAGQVVWRAVKDQESVRNFLRAQGEPDTLEIRGGRFSQKTIILYYTRRSAGAPHSIRLDPVKDGFVPRAPEPIVSGKKTRAPAAGAKPRPQREPRSRRAEPTTAATPTPVPPPSDAGGRGGAGPVPPQPTTAGRRGATAEQRVNCPIDPGRWDCRALCSPGADYEWCR